MKRLSKRELEDISRSFIDKYYEVMKKRGFRKVEKIEPKIMLREVLGLDIQYHILSRNGSILGFTIGAYCEVDVFDDGYRTTAVLDGNTVFIDSKQAEVNRGRTNFTLMHEGAHQLLLKVFPESYDYGVKVCRSTEATPFDPEESAEEWQADYLASILLMPREIVIAGLERYYRSQIYGKYGKKRYIAYQKDSFYKLADYLGVSHQALRIRINDLGLVLCKPPSYIIEFSD